jgi:hypothetical protein
MVLMVEEIVGTVAGTVTVVGSSIKGGGWFLRRRQARKQAAIEATAGSGAATYPVRFTVWSETEFHPGSGYHEGLAFEVYNQSDHPVTIKGFGLEVELLTSGNRWTDREFARAISPLSFPVRLAPHDALTGYVDTEYLGDRLYSEGHEQLASEPFVDVAGFGVRTTEVLNEQPKAKI